jgi:type II secretory pathway pseudopilin PulG
MSYCEHCGSEMDEGGAACPSCGRAPSPAPSPPAGGANPPSKKGRGAILAIVLGCGCMGLLATAGVIAAIAIPNFFDAAQKARQRRTMVDLRSLGMALASYATDSETWSYPEASSVDELSAILVPEFAESVPTADAWQHALRYACWREDSASEGCDTFRLASPGRDGRFERDDLRDYPEGAFEPTDYDRDLVFAMKGFVRYPSGPGHP